ncbi:putative tetratricopeptide-like helical domain superfamily [Helianthus debilis subsp. tardiflorus]
MNLTNSLLIKFRGNIITTPFLLHSNFSTNRSMLHKITNLNHALNLFDEMSQRRPLPSVVLFNQLLTSVTKTKHFSTSLHLFNQMCSLGVQLDKYSISIAIKCCCQLYRTKDGFAVLGCCFRRSIAPNEFIYSALLDGLVLEDTILEAEMLFKKLVKQKLCEPNVVMYNTMIKGLCKFGNNVTPLALLRLRLSTSRMFVGDMEGVHSYVEGICERDGLVGVVEDDMEGVHSSQFLGKNGEEWPNGRWDEASKLLKEMEDENISPNVQTFTALVDAFCKEGKVKEAEVVINIMIERGEVPNILTYSSLIDGYCLRGEMIKAREIFDSLTLRGLVPDVVTYSSLLNGYCKNRNIEEAMQMFRQMCWISEFRVLNIELILCS